MQLPGRTQIGLPRLSRLARNILIGMVLLYIAQIVAQNWNNLPVKETFAWWSPLHENFRPWQPLTAFLLNGPGAISAMLSWLVFYFFFPTAEEDLGRRRTFWILGLSYGVAVAFSLPLQLLGLIDPSSVFLGIHCFLTALTVIFGLTRPQASILLFFILPVRASWVAWGTGIISFFFFLTRRDLTSAVAFFGWCGAVGDIVARPYILRSWYRFRLSRLQREKDSSIRSRFRVIEGGRKGSSKRSDDDPPDLSTLYH